MYSQDCFKTQKEKINTEFKNAIKLLKSGMKSEWQRRNITSTVDKIKFAVNYIALSLIKDKYTNFNNEENTQMINTSIFYCLLLWLENDKESRQTINSFVKQPYTPKSEQKRFKEGENNLDTRKDECSRLRYYSSIYRDNISLQNAQASEEGFAYKRIQYSKKGKVEYDYLALRFMDLGAKGYLELYRLLFLRKEPMKIIKSGYDYSLIEAYKKFYSIVDEINISKSAKEVVIGCIQFVKFENAYRFIFATKLAEQMIIKKCTPQDSLIQLFAVLFHRLPPTYGNHNTSFIGGYNFLKEINEREITDEELNRIISMREIIEDVVFMFSVAFPATTLGAWTENDFDRAAYFFTSEFCVMQEFEDVDFELIEKNSAVFCENIRAIYKNPDFIDQKLFEIGRKNFRGKNHKRCK